MTPYAKQLLTVRAVTVLTGAYVAGTIRSFDRQNYLGILVKYTKGDETSLNLKVESSGDAGFTYGQQTTQTTSGAIVSNALAQYDFTVTGNYWIVINPFLADTVKISVKATGGTPTGTVGVDILTGSV